MDELESLYSLCVDGQEKRICCLWFSVGCNTLLGYANTQVFCEWL